jgi:hypothetical protein
MVQKKALSSSCKAAGFLRLGPFFLGGACAGPGIRFRLEYECLRASFAHASPDMIQPLVKVEDGMKIGENNNLFRASDFSRSRSGQANPGTSGFELGAMPFTQSDRAALEPDRSLDALSRTLSAAPTDSVQSDFLKWAKMNPIERVRASILESKGLDENSLKAMPAEEREAIEKEIREAIKEKFGVNDKGAKVAASGEAGSTDAA